MEGLKKLMALPGNIKTQIDQQYKSVNTLYQKVFKLNEEQYRLTGTKNPRLDQIQNELFDIEDNLDSYGADGHAIVSEMNSDFGQLIIDKKITDLNTYLAPYGTTFDEMKKWLEDNYSI